MNRRLLFAVALLVTFLASILIGGSLRQTPNPPPNQPQPTTPTTTATPADPLAWYRSLPDARTMPACPSGIDPDRYFYRNCPTVPASKRSHP